MTAKEASDLLQDIQRARSILLRGHSGDCATYKEMLEVWNALFDSIRPLCHDLARLEVEVEK